MRESSRTLAWACCLSWLLLQAAVVGGQRTASSNGTVTPGVSGSGARGPNAPISSGAAQPAALTRVPAPGAAAQPLPPVIPTVDPSVQPGMVGPGIVFPSTVLMDPCDPTDPEDESCRTGLVCAPDPMSSDFSTGVCAMPPTGGVVLPMPKGKKTLETVPVAYYALSSNAFRSWPSSVISGTATNVTFRHDPEFGSVLHCKQDARDVVVLDNVKYGTTGAFSINLWIKKDISTDFYGDAFQYIYSHTSLDGANAAQFTPTTPNQVNIYLPEGSHPAHGLIRAVVQDSTDTESSLKDKDFPFLDSDGSYQNDDPRNVTDHIEIEDGQWHMVTLTTNPEGKGYRLYIDGQLAGATPKSKDASGGDPLDVDGQIFLCGRVDNDPARHFDGSLAKLSIYDETLSPSYIEALYKLTLEATETRELLAPAEDDDEVELISPVKVLEDEESGLQFVRLQEIDAALGRLVFEGAEIQEPPKINLTELAKKVTLCVTDPESTGIEDDSCSAQQICASLHPRILRLFVSKSELESEEKFFKDGACAKKPVGGLTMPGPDNELPTPLAFFPLTDGSVGAWPVRNAQGFAVNTKVEPDDAFEKVFHCDQEEGSYIVLDNVPYGEKGTFGINLWFRTANLTGSGFQYLFSHSGVMPTLNTWKENQVQIYLAEDSHSASGILRVILKDSDDDARGPGGQVYLDSDGDVATTIKTKNTKSHVDLSDNEWHMVTVTTRPDRKDGFSLYLDGELAAEVVEGEVYTGDDGTPKFPTGGGMMRPGGKIYLCGRNDGNQDRHFHGELAQLALFDSPLSEDEVAALYDFAVADRPIVSNKVPILRESSTLESISEQTQSIPAGAGDTTGELEVKDDKVFVADLDKRRKLLQQTQPLPAALAVGDDADSSISPTRSNLPKASWMGEIRGSAGEPYGPCDVDSYVEDVCSNGLECVPVATPAPEPNPEMRLTRAGMCAVQMEGLYVFDVDKEIEPPVAYFPLTGTHIDSWPFPAFSGGASLNVSFVDDAIFGSILDCREASLDQVVLDPVDYGAKGTFSINFWVRKKEHHSDSGQNFQFLFSHNNIEGYKDLRNPSQVEIYFPEEQHHLSGIVRVVVRDENDAEEEPTYLDSDGMYSNNEIRELPDDLPKFNDGKWHMISVTTLEGEAGYRLYVDGLLRADASKPLTESAAPVSGGDPTGIDGPIFLCGRSDANPEKHFDGNIVHLGLWNSVLTEQEIYALYERYFLMSQGQLITHPDRVTTDGQMCLFPAFLRGELMIDCAEIDGVLSCPVRDGNWLECAPFEETTMDLTKNPTTSSERFTTDGEKCVFPDTINGRVVDDCVILEGSESRCRTDKASTVWKTCADRVVRYTTDGFVCELPFRMGDKTYTDCVMTDGLERCPLEGEMVECSPRTILDDSDTMVPEMPPPMALAGGRILSRVTVDGDTCIFPFWFKGQSVAQCVDIDGADKCQVTSGELKECADIVYTITGTPCAFPFTDESNPIESIFECIPKNDMDVCKTAEGEWEECTDKEGFVNKGPMLLAGRVTSDNEQCSFPFWFKGKLVSSCIDPAGSQSFVKGSCRSKSGRFAECAPVRSTITGNLCSIPFTYEGEDHYDCIKLNDSDKCMVPNGQWEDCAAPMEPSAPMPVIRNTVNGGQCVLPFMYNGETQSDCVVVGGVESCKDSENEWQECAPVTAVTYVQRSTVDGDVCEIPFQVNGRWHTDCLKSKNTEVCLFEEKLVDCAPLEGPPEYAEKKVEIPNQRATVGGEMCQFPFSYNGGYYVDCVTIDDVDNCKVANGEWQECAPLDIMHMTRKTVDGDVCVFPLSYNGKEHSDCVVIDGFENCKDSDGEWQECAPLNIVPLTRLTVAGDVCAFPFSYNGDEVSDCVVIDGTENCKDSDDEWQECAPLDIVPSARVTVAGDACVFPFSYNGDEVSDCVVIDGTENCKDSDDEWQECAPLDTLPLRRITVAGDVCVFPLSYNGEEVSDCVVIDGTENCKDSAGGWQKCSPLGVKPRKTVNGDYCAFPFQYNGDEYSECVMIEDFENCKTSTGDWAVCAAETIVRATVSGGTCKLPFEYHGEQMTDCVELSGIENCKNEEGEWEECAKDRSTITGIQCRFPFSYKGRTMTECVEVDGVESCVSVNGNWEKCVAPLPTFRPRKTVTGKFCKFPFEFENQQMDTCVPKEGKEVCLTEEGKMEECEAVVTRVSVSGKECVFPATYEGETVEDCVVREGTVEECVTDSVNMTWEQCTPLLKEKTSENKKQMLLVEDKQPVKGSGSTSKSSVIGIIGGAVAFMVVVVIVAIVVFKVRGKKNYEQSAKDFKKFQDDPEQGDNIALSAMGSSQAGRAKKAVGFSDAPEHNSSA